MEPTHQQTLVLSQSYEPVQIVGWKQAITLLFLGKCEVISEHDGFVHSTSLVIKIPAVIRLLNAFRRHKKPSKFSRINVYGRDDYRCQYCGKRRSIHELTYDHVVPRSQGGKTTWTNIVTACGGPGECNARKANRTPAQAGMKLLKQPTQPVTLPTLVIPISRESVPDAWRDYLYWTGSLSED